MFIFLLAVLLTYAAMVAFCNRFVVDAQVVIPSISNPTNKPKVSLHQPLTLVSWNLGYAGLGVQSDFVVDGGTRYFPPSRSYVVNNRTGIVQLLNSLDADFYLLQEMAGASCVNRQVDLKKTIRASLSKMSSVYSSDVNTKFIPFPLNIDIGNGIFTKYEMCEASAEMLPLEGFLFGLVRNNYRMLISRMPIDNQSQQLVVINVHLAAFDDDARIRFAQLHAVRNRMVAEYVAGNYVVVGGDWNLRLVNTSFPHQTDEKFLFWLSDFPEDFLPKGWSVAADDRVATVRTLQQAYVPGENYTCVIDGFVVSPNVKLLDVQNIDQQFQHSDHQPVKLVLTLGESH